MNIATRLVSLLGLVFAASVGCAFAQLTPSSVSKNLIFEGNFIEHHGGIPQGWDLGGFAGGDNGNSLRVTEDRDGNYVTLLVTTPVTAHFTLKLKEQVALRPSWKALVCAVDLRVFNYAQGKENYYKPRLHITFLDETGKELGNTGISSVERLNDAWQTAEREVPIPAGSVVAKVWLGTFGATGQLEFRNPYIAPVE